MSNVAEIVSVNRWDRLALTDAGDVCGVQTFLDEEGDETDDPAAAVVAVGQLPDGRWFSVDMRDYEAARTH